MLIFLYVVPDNLIVPSPSMPDLSDVGPPAKGPGLPYRVPEAPPPPVRVKIEHGWVQHLPVLTVSSTVKIIIKGKTSPLHKRSMKRF